MYVPLVLSFLNLDILSLVSKRNWSGSIVIKFKKEEVNVTVDLEGFILFVNKNDSSPQIILKIMDEETLKAQEYEAQYYGFSSTDVYEQAYEHILNYVKEGYLALQEAAEDLGCKKETAKKKISECYNNYLREIEEPMNRFHEELKKIFAIPKNVLLPEDAIKTNTFSDEEIAYLKNEVEELQKEFIREKVFLAKCQQQRDLLKNLVMPLIEQMNHMMKTLKGMKEKNKGHKDDLYAMKEQYELLLESYISGLNIDNDDNSRNIMLVKSMYNVTEDS